MSILKRIKKGFATNSSSTHFVVFKNGSDKVSGDIDMDINYFGRFDSVVAASKEAKIKYIVNHVYWNDFVINYLLKVYPGSKKYIKYIKDCIEEIKQSESENFDFYYTDESFGTYGGKAPFISENLEFSLKLIDYIITNDDISIVSGSDETDFVFDTVEGLKELKLPYWSEKIYKNGNYYMFKGSYDNTTIVNSFDEELIPQYPELIDLKITDCCYQNCPFCYQNSSSKGKDLDIEKFKDFSYSLRNNFPMEFAIGGGDIFTLYNSELEEIFKILKEVNKDNIINITLNINSLKSLDLDKMKLLMKYVSGVGISISKAEEINYLEYLKKVFNITLHIIPELIGIEETNKILDTLNDQYYYDVLLLGYKKLGRATEDVTKFNKKELDSIFNHKCRIAIDTCFANRYLDYMVNFNPITFTLNEGEFSMYIDFTNETFSKSSYQTETSYGLLNYDYDIEKMFAQIRKDNGMTVYNDSLFYESLDV